MGQRNCERAKDKKERDGFFKKKNEKKGGRKCCIVTERESPSIWKLEDFAFYLHHLLPAPSFFLSFKFSLGFIYNEVLKRETRWKKGI